MVIAFQNVNHAGFALTESRLTTTMELSGVRLSSDPSTMTRHKERGVVFPATDDMSRLPGLSSVSPSLLEDIFNQLPEAVVVADKARYVIYINPAAERLFGYTRPELAGQRTAIFYADRHDFDDQGERRYNPAAASGMEDYRMSYRCADGTIFLARTCGGVIRDPNGEASGYIALIRPARPAEKSIDTLQRLHAISANPNMDSDARIHAILELGARHFGLPVAIQSRIDGEAYLVEQCVSPDNSLSPGTRFELPGTYCVHTLRANRPIGFHHTAQSEIHDHPCYRDFGLEAYLGSPIQVDNRAYGTLNFSSPEPCGPFSQDDLIFMQLLADTVGHEIHERQMRDRLSALARTDELTGLANRRAIMEVLEWQVAYSRRSGLPLCVLSLDLDYFKRINDTWGHAGGDSVLRAFAAILLSARREVDRCGRLGGEEFIVVLPDTGLAGGRAVARRLRDTMAATPLPVSDEESIPVTLSAGLAELAPNDTVTSLLRRVDGALYEAKNGGRDGLCVAGE
ncbi:diguanylate cyclase [Alloalcanivorax profundimaris]|uniref:diguanylate cyclase n=1 Tax=Alloalcanivorax profundimaris TaxID=2735259 RepID=UPI00136DCF2D|nr:diguanylate cyclase [Alloalcanivorax profundimaris]MBF1803517.1 diguanylate cyclase [Alloalcanivorax profundimaris]MBM1144696.1 diguanylate cyclase [Alcanivorax sp. ZXX171]MCQ6261331.1 diguanylate cyclase [Alcanivorax sp. MM125-6]